MYNYYVNKSSKDHTTYCLRFLYIFIIGVGVSKILGKSFTIYLSIAKLQFMFDITYFGALQSNAKLGIPGDA